MAAEEVRGEGRSVVMVIVTGGIGGRAFFGFGQGRRGERRQHGGWGGSNGGGLADEERERG